MRFFHAAIGVLLAVAVSIALGAAPAAKPKAAPAPAAATDDIPHWTESAVPVPGYQAVELPANIAPTETLVSGQPVKVYGQPRNSVGHPCTLWDQQDIDQLRQKLKTDQKLQASLAELKTKLDARMAQPLDVPQAAGMTDPKTTYHQNGANEVTISDLGAVYALTGDAKYGDYCKQMLLAYAENYPKYPHPAGWTIRSYRSANDGRITGQFLEDGFFLCRVAFAYDLVYNLPSWTPDQRKLVHDDLLEAIAREFYDPVLAKDDYIGALHNRSCICTSGVLMAGYATEDQNMVNLALYGIGGSEKDPRGGVFGTHFSPQAILPDGLWVEGSLAYQTGIASCGLFNDCQTLWHHGMNLYAYRNGIVKHLLDSAIFLAYPDKKLSVAALHDGGAFELLDDRAWLNNEVAVGYEYGYERYRDPQYIPIIRNAAQSVSMTIHAGPVSGFPDIPDDAVVPERPIVNANFFSTGFGILRLTSDHGPSQVLMEFGPNAGHAHPSKLGIDFYALGETLMPFPGVIFPYNDPLDAKWYETSLGNCVMTIDQTRQLYGGNLWKVPKTVARPEAQQLVFAPAATLGMERAWSNTVFPGVTQDRSVFMTPNYLADIYAGFSGTSHQYDLAWHFRGKLATELNLSPMEFPQPVRNGYNALENVRQAQTNDGWSAAITSYTNQPSRFIAAPLEGTDVISADGPEHEKANPVQAVLIERQEGKKEIIFANAVDASGQPSGYVKSVRQEGSLQSGFAVARIETVKGADLCLVSFRPGTYQTDGLETDAQQAMVEMDANNVQALYLAGGTRLKVSGAEITRSETGLAYVERLANGNYVVGNPSPSPATVTVKLDSLVGMKGSILDQSGKPASPVSMPKQPGGVVSVQLNAGSKAEFSAN